MKQLTSHGALFFHALKTHTLDTSVCSFAVCRWNDNKTNSYFSFIYILKISSGFFPDICENWNANGFFLFKYN